MLIDRSSFCRLMIQIPSTVCVLSLVRAECVLLTNCCRGNHHLSVVCHPAPCSHPHNMQRPDIMEFSHSTNSNILDIVIFMLGYIKDGVMVLHLAPLTGKLSSFHTCCSINTSGDWGCTVSHELALLLASLLL